MELPQHGCILIQVLQKLTARPHLDTTGTLRAIGNPSALVGRGNGDKAFDLVNPAQALHIITTDDATHTKANQIKRLVRPKGASRVISNLGGEML